MTKSVYFIDDDILFLKLVKFHCKETKPCISGTFFYDYAQDALDVIIQKIDTRIVDESFELFVDINMPGMNGFEFIDLLVENKPDALDLVNIYLLSSSNDPDDIQKAKERLIVKKFLEKPFKKTYLDELCS